MATITDQPSEDQLKVLSNPSQVIKHHQTVIKIDDISYQADLITMKRSFLLVINNFKLGASTLAFNSSTLNPMDTKLTQDEIIGHFMDNNSSLKSLSLAIGEHSTCLIDSNNALGSATLAVRLSKNLNQNRPVYVANNIELGHDVMDGSGALAKLYMKLFQFVRTNYKGAE